MIYCLNSKCQSPENPQNNQYCVECGESLKILRNRYRPVKLLGGGGFGQVYLAEDIDKLNEPCVIKKFEPYVENSEGLQKAKDLFVQEAEQLHKLEEHSQIPTLYAYFEEKGGLYIIQQYIEGETLEQELKKEGVFNEDKITSLLKELLSVLKFVHEHNIIHRDIKPSNIMRRTRPNSRQNSLVLIDLGIAKYVDRAISQTGTIVGTPGYSPLEQMGKGRALPASDLYSLGVTCFHLLTGIPPSNLWQTKAYSWTNEWQKEVKQPVSTKLKTIIDKLLQMDYKNRYQSATDVLKDLETTPNVSTIFQTTYTTTINTKILASQPPTVIQNKSRKIKPLILTLCSIGVVGTGVIFWKHQSEMSSKCVKSNDCQQTSSAEQKITKKPLKPSNSDNQDRIW